jgi:hypothetical protein
VSQVDVSLAAEALVALTRGGIEAALGHLDPDVSPPEWNHARVRKIVAVWEAEVDELRYDADKIIDAGDNGAVVLGTLRGQVKDSDREVSEPLSLHLKFVNGKVTRWCGYVAPWDEVLIATGIEKAPRKTARDVPKSVVDAFERRFGVGPVEGLSISAFVAVLVGGFTFGIFWTIRDVIDSTAAIVGGAAGFAAIFGVVVAWGGLLEPLGLPEAIADGLLRLLVLLATPFEWLWRICKRIRRRQPASSKATPIDQGCRADPSTQSPTTANESTRQVAGCAPRSAVGGSGQGSPTASTAEAKHQTLFLTLMQEHY